MRHRLVWTVAAATFALALSAAGGACRPFTVRDSIAMERFSDPSPRDPAAKIKYSLDHKHFFVVTTRGIVASDQVESTLWLFDTSSVDTYFTANDFVSPPQPKPLVRLRGRLLADQDDSYGSLITSPTWDANSESILYLAENSTGNRQLFRVSIASGTREPLTPATQNVETFDARADTVVFTADPEAKKAPALPGQPINSSASDITGLTLSALLFPDDWGKLEQRRAELWVTRKGQSQDVMDPSTNQPLELSEYNSEFKLAISPDQQLAVVAIPVARIPASWETYTPGMKELRFKPKPTTAKNKSDFLWPIQYGLLDIKSGEIRPLIDAPSGLMAGYYDMPIAIWSSDGSAVLVSNSFLPQSPGTPRSNGQPIPPCAAVVVRLPGLRSECVVHSRGFEANNPPLYLFDGHFNGSTDEVRLRLHNYNEMVVETYRRQGSAWTRVDTHAENSVPQSQTDISLRQGLNTPPALWVSNKAGRAKELWDPAPELASMTMGEASVYRWKDATGYEWIGGLIKPAGFKTGKRYPLIIQTHGFHNDAEFITDGAYTTAFAAREFAAAGFMVLEVRDRHDHMESPEEAANMVRGYESAIAQLGASGLIDPTRVGIIGFSRTCYYVESALLHDTSLYAAASITDGVDESYMQELVFDVDQSFVEGPSIYGASPFGLGLKGWVDAAPGFHLDKVHTPFLITAITPVSILEEWEIYSSLRQQGRSVSFLYIPHGQHILQNPLERIASEQSNVDWFRFWLQGYEDPDPAKASEYARWESLCDQQASENPDHRTYCVRSVSR